jgi:ribonuclease P protein subunit RPR2
LLVDDDAGLRELLRTTFEGFEVEVEEAKDAAQAAVRVAAQRPDVIVLDVNMPGMNGLDYCRLLKADPATQDIGVVLLTGSEGGSPDAADAAGADAFVAKPFSPLELLGVTERVAGRRVGVPARPSRDSGDVGEQLLLYARDLRHLLEIERGQRKLLQKAYRETVAALASALETKDTSTRAHSHRVQRYAIELARAVDPQLVGDESVEYGFLLHDVGKIGIPDSVLLKPSPLTKPEWQLMQTHTVLGEQMLGGVAFLHGEGLKIVRSHHERWDGHGYPDGLGGDEIPLGARVFALADTLDAITSDRPYRPAQPWETAREEIVEQAGRQFDPEIVDAFVTAEPALRRIHRQLATVA